MARKMIKIFVLFFMLAISFGENVDCDTEKQPATKAQPYIEPSFESAPDDKPAIEESPVKQSPIEDDQVEGPTLVTSPVDPVPIESQPSPSICKENEVFGECGNSSCIDRSCANRYTFFPCACNVIGGCVCDSGYFRDEDGGICIPESECPAMTCDGINEEWSECGPNSCNNAPCDLRFSKIACTDICILGGGCHCKSGFFRNPAGVCVPPEQCPPIVGTCPDVNQEWSECGSDKCNDPSCSDLKIDPNPMCTAICDTNNAACICTKGYARDDEGNCIPIDQCPGICGKNQIWDMCGVNQCNQQFCYERFGDDIACIALCDEQNPGCRCESGFYLDDQSNCIPEKDCPPNPCPGLNEKWAPCGSNPCNNIECDKRFTLVACPLICNIDGGCICQTGFYRNCSGICVPESECPPIKCKGENEIFDVCGVNAFNNRTCENRFMLMPEPEICERYSAGCRCIDGFVRNKDGKCILESECPVVKCGPNQVFDLCGPNSCTEKFCGTPDDEPICIMDFCSGEFSGCRCIAGTYRDKYDNCVDKSKCPKCPENEVYDRCGSFCTETKCGAPSNGPVCKPNCSGPSAACRCLEGFCRNEEGKCEKICSSICKENEVFGECGNSSCIDRSCANRNKAFKCACDMTGGCVCDIGYFRDEDGGICIPESECPAMTCDGINEEWSECAPNSCNNVPCDLRFSEIACTDICISGGGCHCKSGFFRNSAGVCVPPEQCPPIVGTCPDVNQEWSECGSNECNDPSCSGLKINPNPMCTAICDTNNAACICTKGYARDDEGNCIPINQCPGICGKNQIWDMCGVNQCNQQFCYERFGDDVACIALCDEQNPGCRCETGFYLDDQSNCIPEKDCPPNPCPGLNEKWAPCGSNPCNNIDCDKRFTPVACNKLCNINGGCICQTGFYRNFSGICVPESECPPIQCKGENEIFDVCGVNAFNNRTCENRFMLMPELEICERYSAGCRCIDGFVRNKDGKCILESECPVVKCGPNQVFDLCGPNSCTEKFCGTPDDEPICIMDFCSGEFSGCRCIAGTYRDKYDNCVDKSKCPKCPENEVYDRCGSSCSETKCGAPPNGPVCKPNCSGAFATCRCLEGFCRNKFGRCQKICTGKNEQYDWCGRNDCNDLNCSNRSLAALCDPFCDPSSLNKCRCETGYFRYHGICISADDCAKISKSKKARKYHSSYSMFASDSESCSGISSSKKRTNHHWSSSKSSDGSFYISSKECSDISREKKKKKHHWSVSKSTHGSSYIPNKKYFEILKAKKKRKHHWSFSKSSSDSRSSSSSSSSCRSSSSSSSRSSSSSFCRSSSRSSSSSSCRSSSSSSNH